MTRADLDPLFGQQESARLQRNRVLLISADAGEFSLERRARLGLSHAKSVGEAIEVLKYLGPFDSVLLDLSVVGAPGIELLARSAPGTTITVYKNVGDDSTLHSRTLDCLLEIGGNGGAAKGTATPANERDANAQDVTVTLTPRQADVLALISEGYPTKVIARLLKIAETTVKSHTHAIFRVLKVRNRTQAANVASAFFRQVGQARRGER